MYIHIYIYTYIKRIEHNVFLQKDAHGFTDPFASLEKFTRLNLGGKPSKYFLQNIVFHKKWYTSKTIGR